ncbi:MAG: arginyl-tRNA synthetase [Parcubacteria group bacterium Gr01-1014_19]|nr:MAG: arginyl-tRNA synthetase [Parcubacteria group bacterium Gr01-1014_19]
MIEKISELIRKVVGEGPKFGVTPSEKPEFGHYATNVAFMVKEDPAVLVEKLSVVGRELFSKVSATGKFINFWISQAAFQAELKNILKQKEKYGASKIGGGKKVQLEFISANPTGPLTMANGRGGFLGDALGNLLKKTGHDVEKEYYVNDAGNQVRLLGESILAIAGKVEPAENHYKGEYVKTLTGVLGKEIQQGMNAADLGRLAANVLLASIKQSVKNAGIKFDHWFSEADSLHKKGELKKTLALLESGGLVAEHDGAKWLKSNNAEEEKDRVLVKSDGQPTYFLADLAYHYDKFIKREFDQSVVIWGADHHGYIARLKAGVKALGVEPERLKILIVQLVRLIENGREVKMSKRAGEFITLDDLLMEVGKDAARFFFLMHNPETHMDFDMTLAKEKSQKNPVYYAQYAVVRCVSIFKKAGILRRLLVASKNPNLALLKSDSEINLVQELVKYPDLIAQTAKDYQVSRLARYSLEVARAFNNFYEKERVIVDDKKLMGARLALVKATRVVLENVLGILGVAIPKEM